MDQYISEFSGPLNDQRPDLGQPMAQKSLDNQKGQGRTAETTLAFHSLLQRVAVSGESDTMSATESVKAEVQSFLLQLDTALDQLQQRLAYQRSDSDFKEHTGQWIDERVQTVRCRREQLEQRFRDFEGHAHHSWMSFRDQIAASFEELQNSLNEADKVLDRHPEDEGQAPDGTEQ